MCSVERIATGSEILESQDERNFVLHSLNASVRGSGINCSSAPALAVGEANQVETIEAEESEWA